MKFENLRNQKNCILVKPSRKGANSSVFKHLHLVQYRPLCAHITTAIIAQRLRGHDNVIIISANHTAPQAEHRSGRRHLDSFAAGRADDKSHTTTIFTWMKWTVITRYEVDSNGSTTIRRFPCFVPVLMYDGKREKKKSGTRLKRQFSWPARDKKGRLSEMNDDGRIILRAHWTRFRDVDGERKWSMTLDVVTWSILLAATILADLFFYDDSMLQFGRINPLRSSWVVLFACARTWQRVHKTEVG